MSDFQWRSNGEDDFAETMKRRTDELYRVKDKAFSEGLSTATDIADANLQVAKVKIEQLAVVYQFFRIRFHRHGPVGSKV